MYGYRRSGTSGIELNSGFLSALSVADGARLTRWPRWLVFMKACGSVPGRQVRSCASEHWARVSARCSWTNYRWWPSQVTGTVNATEREIGREDAWSSPTTIVQYIPYVNSSAKRLFVCHRSELHTVVRAVVCTFRRRERDRLFVCDSRNYHRT